MQTTAKRNEIAKKEFGIDDNLNEIHINDEFEKLHQIVASLFNERVWLLLRLVLSVHIAPIFKDTSNPLALILVDSASSAKTATLSVSNAA